MFGPQIAALPDGLFPATRWSVLLCAREKDSCEAGAAIEQLAKAYWKPLYFFVRQRGVSHEDAADAVQSFFAELLRRDFLRSVEVRDTRFRTFLLAALKNWLVSDQVRAGAQKRGGGMVLIPLSAIGSVGGEVCAPMDSELSVDASFDRTWARSIFEQASEVVCGSYEAGGRGELCREFLAGVSGGATPAYAELATRFGMTEGAVQKAAFDFRARLAAALRSAIRETVQTDAEVDGELRYLIELLGR